MAGYVGTKAVLLSTTAATVGGDADIGGALDVGGAITGVNATLSGGVYLGGTGSANYLDDYEIGDYVATPGLQSGSVTLYSGQDRFSYTKIGRMVRVGGRIRVSAVSSPSGFINIPLPFVAGDLTDESEYSLISIATFGVGLPTGTLTVFGETAPSSSSAILIGVIDNAAWSVVDASNISVDDYITISGSYLTA